MFNNYVLLICSFSYSLNYWFKHLFIPLNRSICPFGPSIPILQLGVTLLLQLRNVGLNPISHLFFHLLWLMWFFYDLNIIKKTLKVENMLTA